MKSIIYHSFLIIYTFFVFLLFNCRALLGVGDREWSLMRPRHWRASDRFPEEECTRALLAIRGLLHVSVTLSYTVATCIVLPTHRSFVVAPELGSVMTEVSIFRAMCKEGLFPLQKN